MNGPTAQIKFDIGTSYKIPNGYGCMGGDIFGGDYLYKNAIYDGILEIKSEESLLPIKFLVFANEKDGFYVCEPSADFSGDVLSIYLKIIVNDKTLEKCIEKIKQPKTLTFKFNGESVE